MFAITICFSKKKRKKQQQFIIETSLAVQWLRFRAFIAGAMGVRSLVRELRFSHATEHSEKKKKILLLNLEILSL